MKSIAGGKIILSFLFFIGLCFLLHILGTEARAAEAAGGWRTAYDLVLKWINFGIIVFLIVKYGKTPVMNFLHGKKDELAREIKRLEEQREKINDKVDETCKLIDESDVRLVKLKDRIIKQGEKKKQQIIENAGRQGQLMLQSANKKIESNIAQAQKTFRDDLIDSAIKLAEEKLPGQVTEKDNRNLLGKLLDSVPK